MRADDAARILIMEDDEDVARLLRVVLGMEGFRPIVAEDGAAGLRLARARLPDLILLDIDMPVMSGLDALRQIRADALLRKIPVVMVTASAHPAALQHAMELGADDYITKPFDTFDLIERVRAILAMEPPARDGRREAVLRQLEVFAKRRR